MGGSVIAPDNSYWCFNFPLELVMLLFLSDMHVPYVRVWWQRCFIVYSLDSPTANVVADVGGLHKLVSLTGYGMVAVARDGLMDETDGEASSKKGASFETSSGRRLVCPLASVAHSQLYGCAMFKKKFEAGHWLLKACLCNISKLWGCRLLDPSSAIYCSICK